MSLLSCILTLRDLLCQYIISIAPHSWENAIMVAMLLYKCWLHLNSLSPQINIIQSMTWWYINHRSFVNSEITGEELSILLLSWKRTLEIRQQFILFVLLKNGTLGYLEYLLSNITIKYGANDLLFLSSYILCFLLCYISFYETCMFIPTNTS